MPGNICHPGLSKQRKPENRNHEDSGGEVMQETAKTENCGNCGYCLFCLSRCLRCGSSSVRVNFLIRLFYSNEWENEIRMDWDHEARDNVPIIRCDACGGTISSIERPRSFMLQGAIWSLLKLPSKVGYRDRKVVATSWATTSLQR